MNVLQITPKVTPSVSQGLASVASKIRKTIGVPLLWSLVLAPSAFVPSALAQSAAEYRQQGLTYRNQGQWEEAIVSLETAVRLDPDNLGGRVLWGWTVHLAGETADAAPILEANLDRDPFHLETLNALGIVYLVQGKVWPAIVTHGWAGVLKPDNEIAFYNLSLGFQRLGLWDWSIATAEYASVLEPYNPHPLVALALAHGSTGSTADTAATIVQATRRLDDRYYDLDFLDHLKEAGFSAEQISQTRLLFQRY